ncbi:MAG TPA: outer membrane protein transport protein [Kofleriaceae bacterium]|jgi:long-chain fatty acid transport protein|nr:outer membrane protein transport protein [Kofleriaceae bacterium]
MRGVSCLLLAAAAPAHAGGFSTARFGGERGHAGTDHLSAIYYNPAGLAHGRGTRVLLEGLFAYRTVDYDRDRAAIDNPGQGTPDDALSANAGEAHLANALVSPFVGIATDAGVRGLGLAIGLYAPFGGQASWDSNDAYRDNSTYPGAVDGTQRWAAIEGEQRALYYTLAGGWRTSGGEFAIGAGLNVVQQRVSLVRARNVNGSDDLVNGTIPAEGRSLLEVDGIDLAASIGVMVKPTPCSRIGLSYQSQPGFGETSLEGVLTNKFGQGAVSETDVVLKQHLPDVVRLGAEWRAFARASLHMAIDYQRWSVYQNQCVIGADDRDAKCEIAEDGSTMQPGIIVNIPRRWKDTFGVRVGGRYFVTDAIELNGGVSFDSNAVPDETMDPSLVDMSKVIGQAGLAWATKRFTTSLSLAHVYYSPRTTAARTDDPMAPSRSPDMAGSYKTQVTYAILGLGVSL